MSVIEPAPPSRRARGVAPRGRTGVSQVGRPRRRRARRRWPGRSKRASNRPPAVTLLASSTAAVLVMALPQTGLVCRLMRTLVVPPGLRTSSAPSADSAVRPVGRCVKTHSTCQRLHALTEGLGQTGQCARASQQRGAEGESVLVEVSGVSNRLEAGVEADVLMNWPIDTRGGPRGIRAGGGPEFGGRGATGRTLGRLAVDQPLAEPFKVESVVSIAQTLEATTDTGRLAKPSFPQSNRPLDRGAVAFRPRAVRSAPPNRQGRAHPRLHSWHPTGNRPTPDRQLSGSGTW